MQALKNTAAVRQHNMQMLLVLTKTVGPVSRAQLARLSGLSQPTVSGAVDGLLAAKLVRVRGEGSSTGGRRPVLLEFNPAAGCVIGIDLGGTTLKLGLTDLGGRLIHRREEPTPTGTSRHLTVMEAILAAVEGLVETTGVSWHDILGVGVGAPGVTDPDAGLVRLAPAVGWQETPVRRLVEERFGVSCRVDNDVNAAARAELVFGHGAKLGSFVFVAIGTGIGAGIVIDGHLHRGAHSAAGEAGYLVIDQAWQPASVEGFGCLESMAAAPAIARAAKRAIPELRNEPAPRAVEALFDLARQGQPVACDVVDQLAGYVGAALTNVAVLLDPDAIILGGGVFRAGDVLLEPVRRKLEALSPIIPQLRLSPLGADAGMLGAAALAIEAAEERLLGTA